MHTLDDLYNHYELLFSDNVSINDIKIAVDMLNVPDEDGFLIKRKIFKQLKHLDLTSRVLKDHNIKIKNPC